MGEIKDRAEGIADETIVKAKRAIGDATDRPDLIAEGDLQEAKGATEKANARVEGALKN